VGAAAQFLRVAVEDRLGHRPRLGPTDADHADLVAILVAEEGDHLGGLAVIGDLEPAHVAVLQDALVDQALDGLEVLGADGLGVGEVEAQAVGSHQGALLADAVAQDLTQGVVQQMGGRVVPLDLQASVPIHPGQDPLAGFQGPGALGVQAVEDDVLAASGVGHPDLTVRCHEHPGVAHLATHLGVEGSPVQDDRPLVALAERGRHGGLVLQQVVACEQGGLQVELLVLGQLGDLHLGGSGSGPLLLHARLEAGLVDGKTAFAGHDLGQVQWEAVGVIQFEGHLAGKDASHLHASGLLLEQGDAPVQRLVERGLFAPHDLLDLGLLAEQLGKDIPHGLGQDRHQVMKEGVHQAQLASVAGRPTQDPAHHVAAALVGGDGSVGDGEGHHPQVVGADPHGDGVLVLRDAGGVGPARQFLKAGQDGTEQGRVVVRYAPGEVAPPVGALHDRRDAVQAGAGVHVAGRQLLQAAVGLGVEFDEDQVPQLHDLGGARVDQGAARGVRGQVDVDLRAGAAGAHVAHHPEVVLGPEALDV